MPSLPTKMKILSILAKNCWKTETFPVVHYFIWKLELVSNIFDMDMNGYGLLQIGHKSEKWQLRHNLSTWRHRQFFWHWRISFFKFSYWSKFHANIITGSNFITIFLYKGLIRNPKIQNTPASAFCPISGDWGELEIQNLAQMPLMKCYWMLQNSRVIEGNPAEGKITPTPSPPRLGLPEPKRTNEPYK